MTNDTVFADRELIDLAIEAVATSGATTAVRELGPAASAQELSAVYGPLLSLSLGRMLRHVLARRLPPFLDAFAATHDSNPTRARLRAHESAKANENNADYHDAMYRSFRAMMDAADDSTIPALGRLAALYTSHGQKPDSFFRAMARLLCELEGSELEQLNAIFRLSERALHESSDLSLEIADGDLLVAHTPRQILRGPASIVDATRLFTLLKREGLAEGRAHALESRLEAIDPNRWMRLNAHVTSRIANVLGLSRL